MAKNSLDLVCYNQEAEFHVHNVFVLFVSNGVSRSVVTDNLYSFSSHLLIVLQVQIKLTC